MIDRIIKEKHFYGLNYIIQIQIQSQPQQGTTVFVTLPNQLTLPNQVTLPN